MIILKKIISSFLNCNHDINYMNFGYIKSGSIKRDLIGKFFGRYNFLKRLQAKDIIQQLDLKSSDVVLDFGCGSGYFTIEIAKKVHKALGIDSSPGVTSIPVPLLLKDKLDYLQVSGEDLHFKDSSFDKILVSEVLATIKDPNIFIKEIQRVLKPNGLIVIINGAGHPAIKTAFEKKPFLIRFLKKLFPKDFPNSYSAYCSFLQHAFKNAQNHYFSMDEIKAFLQDNGFEIIHEGYTPGYLAGSFFSWTQFIRVIRKKEPVSEVFFPLKYYIFSFLRFFELSSYRGGVLCVGRNKQN